MNQAVQTEYQTGMPVHEYFYKLVDESLYALDNIPVYKYPKSGIRALKRVLRRNRVKPAFGSLRLDRDMNGVIFLQKFIPNRSAWRRGYYQSIEADCPFWEILGTEIIRLHGRNERLQQLEAEDRRVALKKHGQFCVFLQGNMDKKYLQILLEQGRYSYDTLQSHLKEEPIFSALSVLSRLSNRNVIETNLFVSEYLVHLRL